MSEATAAPEAEVTDTSDADFDSGFRVGEIASTAAAATETPPAADDLQETPPAATDTPETPPTAEEPPAPKLAAITEDEYRDLVSKASKVDELQSRIDQSFGRFGQKLAALTEQLQAAAPSGAKVEITDEMVADLTAEFPEMGGLVRKAFEKFAEKLPSVSAPSVAPAIDPSLFAKVEDRATQRAKAEMAREALDETHEGWDKVIGLPDKDGNIPDTPFRKWLATQPEDYRNRVNHSFVPATIGKAIDAFRESQKKAEAQAAARKARINAGVAPRGDGGAPAPASTEDDEFNAGFRG